MKKQSTLILLATAAMASCNAGAGPIDQKGANVFPSSAMEDSISITMGDVMPFYDDGVMNIYHLRNVTGTNSLFYHPIARLATSDFIHYENCGIALNYEESVSSIDAALGTGSFIKDDEGVYHCFYTGHNDKAHDEELSGAGLIHKEALRHATSKDNQKTWQKDEDFLIFGYEDDFRDPYVYRDSKDHRYYMLVTTRDYANPLGPSVIRRFGADSLNASAEEWEFVDNFFTNDAGDYNMECPSYIELGGYQYLAYSEQGDNRVTHYRYRTSSEEQWKAFPRDAIDASGFYAGRLEKAGDKLFAFAWCARLTGGNTGSFDWAGNLVSHELRQDASTGELFPVMPYTYKDYFNHVTDLGQEEGNFLFDGSKFEARAIGKLGHNVTRLSMKVKADGNVGDFGLTFGLDGKLDNRLGDGTLTFDLSGNKLSCHNNVSNILRYGPELTSVSYAFETGKTYDVDLIIDGEIYSVYLNNEIALTARLINMVDNHISFYSNQAKVSITEVKAYE